MLIMLLFFSTLLKAEDLSTEKYCFQSVRQMELARKSFESIKVPSDETRTEDKCLTILMRPHRFGLIHKYMTSSFPEASIAFSTESLKRDPCQLKVEKIKTKKGKDLEIAAGQGISLEQIDTNETSSEVGQIQTLKEFELIYDQDQIKGTCRFINADRYEISLEVRKNPKPTNPVVIQPPTDQETMALTTQVQLTRGERIEIGSVLKEENNKKQRIDIKPSVDLSQNENLFSEKVFLSIQ